MRNSIKGVQACAIEYSITETAKLNNVNSYKDVPETPRTEPLYEITIDPFLVEFYIWPEIQLEKLVLAS